MSVNKSSGPVFITDLEVKSVLTWPMVNSCVEEALKSVNPNNKDNKANDLPYCNQPARTFTPVTDKNSILFCMPGFVGNYCINGEKTNSLGCKVVTSFQGNSELVPKIPNVLANILLFDHVTGRLKAVIDGTEITAWRTASASIVATKYLFPISDNDHSSSINLAIVGCGVQGTYHSLGFCSTFYVSTLKLWNRTHSRALELAAVLEKEKKNFKNPNLEIIVTDKVRDCVSSADVIVTGTYTAEPLIHLDMLSKRVHINSVGAGQSHHSEIAQDVYDEGDVYIDYWAGANTELKNLKANKVGEVGDVINKQIPVSKNKITIFHSLGMAAEDATVAQAVYNAVMQTNKNC